MFDSLNAEVCKLHEYSSLLAGWLGGWVSGSVVGGWWLVGWWLVGLFQGRSSKASVCKSQPGRWAIGMTPQA